MSISTVMNISMGGMRAQATRAAAIADNVANVNTPGYVRAETRTETQPPAGVRATVTRANAAWPDRSDVDLAAEILDLTETQIAFKANAVVFDTGADMWEMLSAALDGKRR
jgi:flagellar basal-body rod protein FlgC